MAILLSLCLIWTSGDFALAAMNSPSVFLAPPAALGRITSSFNLSPQMKAPAVILIEDLHAHYGVQKNIAGLLDFLTKKLTPETPVAGAPALPFALAVEGAEGPLDSSVMALFPDQKIKHDALEYLLHEGELSGMEYFAAMRGLPHALVGVEDGRYYQANRDLFRQSFKNRARLAEMLQGIQAELGSIRPVSGQDNPELTRVDEDLTLLLKIANLQATENEVRAFGHRLNEFVALSRSLLTSSGLKTFDEDEIRELLSTSVDYYALAMARNQPMVEHTLALMDQRGIAVLVAGGFHTAMVTKLLRERQVSYVVITPSVDRLTDQDHELYLKRLNGELLTPEQILADANAGGGTAKRRFSLRREDNGLATAVSLSALGIGAVVALAAFGPHHPLNPAQLHEAITQLKTAYGHSTWAALPVVTAAIRNIFDFSTGVAKAADEGEVIHQHNLAMFKRAPPLGTGRRIVSRWQGRLYGFVNHEGRIIAWEDDENPEPLANQGRLYPVTFRVAVKSAQEVNPEDIEKIFKDPELPPAAGRMLDRLLPPGIAKVGIPSHVVRDGLILSNGSVLDFANDGAQLIIIDHKDQNIYRLIPGKPIYVLGRKNEEASPDVGIAADNNLSRLHLEFRNVDGKWQVRHVSSKGGTWHQKTRDPLSRTWVDIETKPFNPTPHILRLEWNRMVEKALAGNVYLSMSRAITPESLAVARLALGVIEEMKSILKKAREPIRLDITRLDGESRLGEAFISETIGPAQIGVTQLADQYGNNPALQRSKTRQVISHELLHKLSTVPDASDQDLVMPIQDWIDLLKLHGMTFIHTARGVEKTEEYLNVSAHGFAVVTERIRDLSGDNFPDINGRSDYERDPHEIVARHGTGVPGHFGAAGRSPQTLTLLQKNLLRSKTRILEFVPSVGIWIEKPLPFDRVETVFPAAWASAMDGQSQRVLEGRTIQQALDLLAEKYPELKKHLYNKNRQLFPYLIFMDDHTKKAMKPSDPLPQGPLHIIAYINGRSDEADESSEKLLDLVETADRHSFQGELEEAQRTYQLAIEWAQAHRLWPSKKAQQAQAELTQVQGWLEPISDLSRADDYAKYFPSRFNVFEIKRLVQADGFVIASLKALSQHPGIAIEETEQLFVLKPSDQGHRLAGRFELSSSAGDVIESSYLVSYEKGEHIIRRAITHLLVSGAIRQWRSATIQEEASKHLYKELSLDHRLLVIKRGNDVRISLRPMTGDNETLWGNMWRLRWGKVIAYLQSRRLAQANGTSGTLDASLERRVQGWVPLIVSHPEWQEKLTPEFMQAIVQVRVRPLSQAPSFRNRSVGFNSLGLAVMASEDDGLPTLYVDERLDAVSQFDVTQHELLHLFMRQRLGEKETTAFRRFLKSIAPDSYGEWRVVQAEGLIAKAVQDHWRAAERAAETQEIRAALSPKPRLTDVKDSILAFILARYANPHRVADESSVQGRVDHFRQDILTNA